MSDVKDILSKIKQFDSKHSSSAVVKGRIKKKDVKEHYDNFKELQDKVRQDKRKIINYEQIQDIYNIYNIDEIFEKIDKNFKNIPSYKIKQYDDYIIATNNLVKALIDNNVENIEKYTQEHCDLVNKIDEQQIEMQASMLASMKSGNSMISSISGADSKKMVSSIMTSRSKLSDNTKSLQDKQSQSRPQEDEKQIQFILDAFAGLYDNYYKALEGKTKDTQKQQDLDQKKIKKNNKIDSENFKNCIRILLYPTEKDKKPNPKKENESNYDISLKNFNKYVGDICKKYKVENIEKLITKEKNTSIRKFARQIQSFQMCCAARETQEMFMESSLGAGIF